MGSRSWSICNPSDCSFSNRLSANAAFTRVRALVLDALATRARLGLNVLGKAGCGKPARPVRRGAGLRPRLLYIIAGLPALSEGEPTVLNGVVLGQWVG